MEACAASAFRVVFCPYFPHPTQAHNSTTVRLGVDYCFSRFALEYILQNRLSKARGIGLGGFIIIRGWKVFPEINPCRAQFGHDKAS